MPPRNLLGEQGGRVMAALIAGGLISSISAMTWAGPRVAQAVGQDFPALRLFRADVPGRRSARGYWCADAPRAADARDLDV